MKISTTQNTLRGIVREFLDIESNNHPIIVNEPPLKELPVNSDPRGAFSSIFDLPPIDDENYIPTNSASLAKAAYALAKEVDSTKSEKFYKLLKKLVDKMNSEVKETEEMTASSFKESLRREIRKILRESLLNEATPEDWDEFYADEDEEEDLDLDLDADLEDEEPADFKTRVASATSAAEKTPWVQRDKLRLKPKPKKVTWDDLARSASKKAGASDGDQRIKTPSWADTASEMNMTSAAIRKDVDRIKQVQSFAMNALSQNDNDEINVFATNEYIKRMKDLVSPEAYEELKYERDVVRTLPSFTEFRKHAIFEPGYDAFANERFKMIRDELESMNIDHHIIDTVSYMITNRTNWDMNALDKKMIDYSVDPKTRKRVLNKMRGYHMRMNNVPEDFSFPDLVKTIWNSKSEKEKQKKFEDTVGRYIKDVEQEIVSAPPSWDDED